MSLNLISDDSLVRHMNNSCVSLLSHGFVFFVISRFSLIC